MPIDSVTAPPRPAYLDLIDEHRSVAAFHRSRVRALLAVPAVVGFLVGIGATVSWLPIWAVVVCGAGLAIATSAYCRQRATSTVLRRLGAREARGGELVRVENMLDELSLTIGVAKPRVLVVGGGGVETMVVGVDESKAALVVTAELVGGMETMELEALLAHALLRVKDLTMAPSTVAVTALALRVKPLIPLWRRLWARLGPESPVQTDYRTVRVTRYPPALVSVLHKIGAKGAPVAVDRPGGASLAHLWTVPSPDSALGETGTELSQRIAILQEI